MILIWFDFWEVLVPIWDIEIIFVSLFGFSLHHVVYGFMLRLLFQFRHHRTTISISTT